MAVRLEELEVRYEILTGEAGACLRARIRARAVGLYHPQILVIISVL